MKFTKDQYRDIYCPDCGCVQRHRTSQEGGVESCTCLVCGSEQCNKKMTGAKIKRAEPRERER